MSEQRIRPLALCIFHHHGKILVNQFYDAIKQQMFFRPVGGGIEFGERSHDAIVREVQEELGASISDLRLVGTLESIFTYDGKPGHEIVQVYDARFDDTDLYEKTWLEGFESNGASSGQRGAPVPVSPLYHRWCLKDFTICSSRLRSWSESDQ